MQAFQTLLCLAKVARVLDGIALGVGIEGFQPYINPDLFSCWLVNDVPRLLYPELAIIPVSASYNAYSFQLLGCINFVLVDQHTDLLYLRPFSSSLFLFFSSACKVEEPFIPGFKSAGLSGSLSVTTGGQSIFAPEDLKIGEKICHVLTSLYAMSV